MDALRCNARLLNQFRVVINRGSFKLARPVHIQQFQRRSLANIATSTTASANERRQPSLFPQLDKDPSRYQDFSPIYLRDSCTCPRCVDPSSRQKNFQTTEIPETISIRNAKVLENGDIQITWENDLPSWGKDHVSVIPQSFIDIHSSRAGIEWDRAEDHDAALWDAEKIASELQFVDFNEYQKHDEVLHRALAQLQSHGLVIVRGVPDSEKAVEDIAGRIGTLRDSFYGRTWDVRSVPKAKNVAYTSQFLGLHMDLLYMANPPGFQFLHCLHNSCEGGASIFSDSFYAASRLTPAQFEVLSKAQTAFHYRNAGEHYYHTHSIIEVSDRDPTKIKNINWSPPFQGPYPIPPSEQKSGFVEPLKAARKFAALVESPENLFEYKLQEGECVIFNNRRVLHGRRQFDTAAGERWLKGAYIDTDVFMSKFRVLNERYRAEEERLDQEFPEKYINSRVESSGEPARGSRDNAVA